MARAVMAKGSRRAWPYIKPWSTLIDDLTLLSSGLTN